MDIDNRILAYLLQHNSVPSPVRDRFRGFAKLSKDGRLSMIQNLESQCENKWKNDHESRHQLEEEYRVPKEATEQLDNAIQDSFATWKFFVLANCDKRLTLNQDWYDRLVRLAHDHPDRDFLVVLGAAHLGTVRTATGTYPGILKLLIDKPGPFNSIGWAWTHNPETPFIDDFLRNPDSTKYSICNCGSNNTITTRDIPMVPEVSTPTDSKQGCNVT
ncbi:MAG: hypothetical protein ACD_21C00202G0006 [uncultured bacterium]|nr:MAG: hypothetical protein ACD_21C00202G0006 [uncultured bacterium]